jgi:LDH2 family malate/lactate/ureidoglycolate dehydrogenase
MIVTRLCRHSRRSFSTQSNTSSSTTILQIPIEEARTTTAQALQQIGWNAKDAALQADIMIAAELCGNNQGLVKMYQPKQMAPAPGAGVPSIERETPSSAVLNANKAPGMLAAVTAADLAVQKVLENNNSIAMVCAYNSCTSSGQLAYYVHRMAQKGCIGVALCNSPEFVAAAPGAKPVFGTNPLAIGIPRAGTVPYTFDMATSAIALFGVLSAQAKGEPLPPQVAYDAQGQFTTDAQQVMNGGAIATFGGHKGLGLSLCVELLAGALSGAAVLGQVESKKMAQSWGHTFIAINPHAFVDDFEEKSALILRAVQASGDNVRIPGERSVKTAQERQAAGVLPIPQTIWDSICHTAQHGLETPSRE